MRDKGTMSREAFEEVRKESTKGGTSATHASEQEFRRTGKINSLVDPSKGGVIRLSLRRFTDVNGLLYLPMGMPMSTELACDVTTSMGGNVDKAFHSLPESYGLSRKVLERYDLQMINSIFQDECDDIVLMRSMAEMDKKIAEQLALMVPLRGGGDFPEDPEYALFGAAYLTRCDISAFGLKTYHFMVTDATSHGRATRECLIRVFGKEVFKKTKENGWDLEEKDEYSVKEIVKDLLKKTHAFVFQVGSDASSYWRNIYGRDRVIMIPDVDYLSQAQAAVIGLTEGTLTLQNIEQFLIKEGKMSKPRADELIRAVSGIPLGAQAELPNFDSIPLAGSYFRTKEDIKPVSAADVAKMKKGKSKEEWL